MNGANHLFAYELDTDAENLYNITRCAKQAVLKSMVQNGICIVYCPHTTAGITINENADPDVIHDFLLGLRNTYPECAEYRHAEGNTTAHLKASAVGSSATVIIHNGTLLLGRWQGIYFCEFDGPRKRRFHIKIMADNE